MRYSAEHNDVTRKRILAAASRLFREQGVAAVGLATVMAEANLTVGTFYSHFESKEALLQEALAGALDARAEQLQEASTGADFETLVRAYLSPTHRDAPGNGCPVAALAAEVARHPDATRHTFTSHNARSLDALGACVAARRGGNVGRAESAAFLGLLIGTLQLARATPDRADSDALLEAGVRAALKLAS